jgi:hypothetical protein
MKAESLIKHLFILGSIIDGAISVSWFLIAAGWEISNILNGYTGSGPDYRLAMYVAAMFMAGWTILLAWGALKPVERRGLLLITAGFLLLSVIAELTFYRHVLGGPVLVFGVTKRLVLTGLFMAAYIYSRGKGGLTVQPISG